MASSTSPSRSAAQAAVALLSDLADAAPLVPHAAATSAGRREGLVVASEAEGTDHRGGRWTEEDSARALAGTPFEERLGLRFYLEDPLPRIAEACAASGKKFLDHEFPCHPGASVSVRHEGKTRRVRPGIVAPSNCADLLRGETKRAKRVPQFLAKAEREWEWIRASTLSSNSGVGETLGLESVGPRDVLQDRIGNCGFCSGLASVAAGWPELLRDALGPYSEEGLKRCGAYSFRLHPRGKRRYLLLDDYVICSRRDGREHGGGGGSGSGDNDTSGNSGNRSPNERDSWKLWTRLLEKAFVKLQGTYASLDGHYKFHSLYRHPARALQVLTGAPLAFEARIGGRGDGRDGSPLALVYHFLRASEGAYARVAHCRKTVDGLRNCHGYSLLWAGEAAGVRLVCLRNPHGRGPYLGHDWGRGSARWWEERLQIVSDWLVGANDCFELCPSTGFVTWKRSGGAGNVGEDDGIFFVGLETFVECFPLVTLVGPLPPPGYDGGDGSGDGPEVPDCVYRTKRENLHEVKGILEMARGQDLSAATS